jgi:hypothetical protein
VDCNRKVVPMVLVGEGGGAWCESESNQRVFSTDVGQVDILESNGNCLHCVTPSAEF